MRIARTRKRCAVPYAICFCANVRAVFGKGRNDWPFCFCYLIWSTTKHKLVGESKVNTRFKRCSSFFANKRRGPSSHSKSRWQLSSSRRWLPHRLCLFIWFCCYKIHDGFLNSRRLYRLPMQTTPKLWQHFFLKVYEEQRFLQTVPS